MTTRPNPLYEQCPVCGALPEERCDGGRTHQGRRDEAEQWARIRAGETS